MVGRSPVSTRAPLTLVQIADGGTQTGVMQHELMTQTEPAGHELPARHAASVLHGVVPCRQMPPPVAVDAQTHPGVGLQVVKVPQMAPAHAGLETCAATGATDVRIIGATYAAPPV